MPSMRAVAKFFSSAFSSTASATGRSMSVVAVLDIHMLSTALAAMKPKTSRRLLLPPKARTMVSAIRRWAPLRARAVDRMNPPSSSSMSGCP